MVLVMAKYDYDIIVIGGGAAGLTASTFAGQSAAKTLLIEKEKNLGGDCLHFGCVPSKSLIKSAHVRHMMARAEQFGLPAAQLMPVDFSQIRERIRKIISTIQKHDEPEYIERKYNVETKFGAPHFINNHTIELSGKQISARYFLIATGSSAFIPPIEGIDSVKYITNVEIFSLDQLPESMVVIGAGPIGMEMAQSFHRLGSKVTVLETADRILPREDKDVSCYVHQLLVDEGLEIITSARVIKAAQKGDIITITYQVNDEKKDVQSKALFVAAGRKANIEGLALENAGIMADRVIQVNSKMRTTAKNIYACGDVTGGFQFTHTASYEAVVAIYNAILKIPRKADLTNVIWCTYLDPEVASIGYNEQRARAAGINFIVHKESFSGNDRALAEGETKGFIKLVISKKGSVIGVQMVGFHAGDLIHEWVPVLNGKLKLSVLTDSIHAYPTMAEINKNASVRYLVSTIPSWTKKITKLLFGYQGKV